MVTAYDANAASILEEAGVPLLLVGDSLGMVVLGYDSTVPVTLDEILHHTKAVVRGRRHALVVVDLPFGTYQPGTQAAMTSAIRALKTGAHAVKLEGGGQVIVSTARLVEAGIPVMGHIGLTPQSVHQLGGFRVQGRGEDAAARLLREARIVQDAGAYALVLEMVPATLARQVTEALAIPTIGIGAGNGTSGQVLVCYDMLGLNDGFRPKFLKRFAELGTTVREATAAWVEEVRTGTYPGDDHSFS